MPNCGKRWNETAALPNGRCSPRGQNKMTTNNHTLTPKQEAACRAYIETGSKSAAYRHAYNTKNMKNETVWRRAVELFDNGKVAARLEALQAEHRRVHDVTIESLTKELEEARTLAIANGQASAAVQATMGIAKLHGLLVDRSEVKTTNDMTLAEVRARIKEIEAELAEAGDEAVQAPTQH